MPAPAPTEPPYGWRVDDDGHLVPEPGEQAVIDAVRLARGQGEQLRTIAFALNAGGLATRAGKPWNSAAIAAVLHAGISVGDNDTREPKNGG